MSLYVQEESSLCYAKSIRILNILNCSLIRQYTFETNWLKLFVFSKIFKPRSICWQNPLIYLKFWDDSHLLLTWWIFSLVFCFNFSAILTWSESTQGNGRNCFLYAFLRFPAYILFLQISYLGKKEIRLKLLFGKQ